MAKTTDHASEDPGEVLFLDDHVGQPGMVDTNQGVRGTGPGFWKSLFLALEAMEGMGESHEDQLERRVSRLEREVTRLLRGLEETRPASSSGTVK